MDAEREKRLQDFNFIIRSVLMSASRGVPKSKLAGDYRNFVGKPMNESLYQLGYRSMDDFVRNNRHVVREATGPTGEPTYFAVTTSDTAHVAKLIARQKKPSLKKMTRPPPRLQYQNPRKFHKSAPLPRIQKHYYQGRGFQSHHPLGPSNFKPAGYSQQQPFHQQKYFGNRYGNQTRPGGFQSHVSPGNPSSSSHVTRQQPLKPYMNQRPQPGTPHYYQSETSPTVVSNRSCEPGSTQSVVSEVPLVSQLHRPASKGSPTSFIPTTPVTSPPDILKAQAQGIPPWKPEFDRVAKTFHSVEELIKSKGEYDYKMICVYGFPGGVDKIRQYTGEYRLLLSDSENLRPFTVNIFFQKPKWDISIYPDPLNVCRCEGVRLRVIGTLSYKLWKSRGEKMHSISVAYYERIYPNVQTSLAVTVSGDPHRRREVTIEKALSSSSNSLNSTSSSSSHDTAGSGTIIDSDIQQWLRKVLSNKPNGLWFKVLLKNYEERFHRSSSYSSFLDMISAVPFIKLDNIGVSDNPIVLLVKELVPAVTERNINCAPRASFSQEQDTEKATFPGRVEFPNDSEWADVFVVCADSPMGFYVQLTAEDHVEAFKNMTAQMNKYFSTASKAAPMEMGVVLSNREEELFASCWEDEQGEEGSWCRTIVEGPTSSESLLLVHYPDYGNSGELEITELRRLPTEFYKLPFQSIPCSLEGAIETSQEALNLFSKLAFEKSGVVQVIKRGEEKNTVELLVDNDNVKMSLLNSLHPVETLIPTIPQSGKVAVKLTDVDKSKEELVAVQVLGLGTERLAELNEVISATLHKGMKAARMFSTGEVTEGTVCCCVRGEQCYRVKVKEVLERRLLIEYLDYGNKELVEATSLRKELDGEKLFRLPPQAVRCNLHGIPPPNGVITDRVVNWLGEYFEAENLQLEMVSEGGCRLWHGDTDVNDLLANEEDFFREECFVCDGRSSASEPPASPPASLSDSESVLFHSAKSRQCCSPDLSSSSDSDSQKQQCLLSPKSAPFVPLSSSTSSPYVSIPSGVCTPKELLPDELFCGSVIPSNILYEKLKDHGDPVRLIPCYVRSPHEFTVQLHDKLKQLEEMQVRLQKHCNSPSSRKLLEFKEGTVCAAHSREYGHWYRAMLTDALIVRTEDGRTVEELSVKYVDYGNIETVSVLDVKVLPKPFLDLPFQGIAARLSDVAPVIDEHFPEKGWPPEACSHFEELLFDKEQALFGMATGEMRGIYSVRLIQVPGSGLIGDMLVEQGLARSV